MITRKNLEKKLNQLNKECIITVCTLPSGGLETIVNYMCLDEKRDYLLNAYDEQLKLKTMPDIKLIDCIVISTFDY